MQTKLFRTDEVAKLLDVPVDRITRMARAGELPAVRCGRTWRFCPDQIRAWIETGGGGAWKRRALQSPREAAR